MKEGLKKSIREWRRWTNPVLLFEYVDAIMPSVHPLSDLTAAALHINNTHTHKKKKEMWIEEKQLASEYLSLEMERKWEMEFVFAQPYSLSGGRQKFDIWETRLSDAGTNWSCCPLCSPRVSGNGSLNSSASQPKRIQKIGAEGDSRNGISLSTFHWFHSCKGFIEVDEGDAVVRVSTSFSF